MPALHSWVGSRAPRAGQVSRAWQACRSQVLLWCDVLGINKCISSKLRAAGRSSTQAVATQKLCLAHGAQAAGFCFDASPPAEVWSSLGPTSPWGGGRAYLRFGAGNAMPQHLCWLQEEPPAQRQSPATTLPALAVRSCGVPLWGCADVCACARAPD